MMCFSEKDDGVSKELTRRIKELVSNSKYNLTSFQYSPQYFGNIVIELTSSDKSIVRFIYDRGDIYRDKKAMNSMHWTDEQLIYSHSTPRNEIYELLIKAINKFLKEL